MTVSQGKYEYAEDTMDQLVVACGVVVSLTELRSINTLFVQNIAVKKHISAFLMYLSGITIYSIPCIYIVCKMQH